MEIYAQQQQLQQYSNQRAQLTPTQVQQMYIMRNSRSNPSIGSGAAPAATTGTTAAPPGITSAAVPSSAATVSAQDSSLTAKDESSVKGGGQVTVKFEATSFSIQDNKALSVQTGHSPLFASPTSPTTDAASTMPGTACAKFFEVPELIEHLGLFLRPHDLAQLLRTSRDIYNAMISYFWRFIDLEDDHRVDRLISTPDTLVALTRNAPFVHSLKTGYIFMSYYFEGIMRYLDEQEQDEGEMEKEKEATQPTTDSTARFERPRWLPRPSVRNHRACALPPMTRLTQLDVCFDRVYRGVQLDNAMLVNSGIRLLRPLV
ncbi:hypothetical protein BGX24_001230 [Mortierella sp. AD032]|nr:hypothetical protein BGX24_001230 [Mortierella sp. AD032]